MKERQGGQDRHNKSKSNQPEQLPRSRDGKNPEPDLPPSVWDILERQVKLWAPGGPRTDTKEFVRETSGIKLLKEEIEKKGTARETLTFALYELEKMFMRPDHPGRDILKLLGVPRGHVFLEELHSLRSRVQAMSDEQLVERVRWLEELKGPAMASWGSK
jgi:hypothetical protein